MKRKWKDALGETLVEVMASILIGALSVVLLFTAVMSSSKLDKTAQTVDGDFEKALAAAEEQTTPASSSVVPSGTTVTVRNDAVAEPNKEKAVDVTFFGGEGALSYKLQEVAGS